MMKKITALFYFLLAISFAFGSFNPFDLRSSMVISDLNEAQNGYTPILFFLCILLSLLDGSVRRKLVELKKYIIPLYGLLLVFILSAVVHDINTFWDFGVFFIKLFVAFTGFGIFSLYFVEHEETFLWTLRIFALTCSLIIILFFTGNLEGFYYYSKGRLILFGENANSYSFIMGLCALVLLRELSNSWPIVVKALLVLMIVLSTYYILMSGSRGTVLILGLTIVILYFDYLKKHFFVSSIVSVSIVIALIYLYNSSTEELSIFSRMSSLSEGDERVFLMKNALSLFVQSPFLGIGINGYFEAKTNVFHDLRDSHNMLVSILVNGGVFGLVMMVTFLIRIFRNASKVFRTDRYPVALFVYIFFISLKTGDIISYSLMWFVFSIIVVTTFFSSYRGNQEFL